MKLLIYISGILGGTLLLMSLLNVFSDNYQIQLLFYLGLILIVCIFLPLYIVDSYKQNKKINDIINSYKGKKKDKPKINLTRGHTTSGGIDEYPLHSSKSGLTWGGGNIHGANASRGTKRKFLKK